MTHYLSLANLLASLPDILTRLTTVARRSRGSGPAAGRHAQSSQSPPGLTETRERRDLGLWAHRLRIQDARAEYLSAHLRRDIGLDH